MIGKALLVAALLVVTFWLVLDLTSREEMSDPIDDGAHLANKKAPELAATVRKTAAETDDAEERAAAVALLAELGGQDEAAQLRVLQARRGRTPFDEALVRHLIGLLEAKDPKLRWRARVQLQGMDARIAPLIAPLFTSESVALRQHAIGLLAVWLRAGYEVQLPDLLSLLDDADRSVNQGALSIICAIGIPYDEAIAKKLLVLLDAGPSPGRSGSTERGFSSSGSLGTNGITAGLARMGPQGIALLLPWLESSDALTRTAVLIGLSVAEPEQIKANLEAVEGGLRDPEPRVQSAALLVLQKLQGDCVACLPALQAIVQDDELPDELIQSTLYVVGQMGSRAKAAVPWLVERLDKHEEFVADSIAETLAAIGARPDLAVPALTTLVEKEFSDAGAKALAAFGRHGYEAARRAYDQGDEDVRFALLWTFATYGEGAAETVPLLLPLIEGEDYDMRERAIGTVGFIGPRAAAALPTIMEQLAKGPDVLPPRAASATLVRMGKAGEDALLRGLRSKDARMRLQSAAVVEHFQGRSYFAFDALEGLLGDPDVKLRRAALKAAAVTVFHVSGGGVPEEIGQDPQVRKRLRILFERAAKDADAKLRAEAEAWLKRLDQVERAEAQKKAVGHGASETQR